MQNVCSKSSSTVNTLVRGYIPLYNRSNKYLEISIEYIYIYIYKYISVYIYMYIYVHIYIYIYIYIYWDNILDRYNKYTWDNRSITEKNYRKYEENPQLQRLLYLKAEFV